MIKGILYKPGTEVMEKHCLECSSCGAKEAAAAASPHDAGYFLCLRCLKDREREQAFIPVKKLIEGEDYYLENGRWVFTEVYHHKRGYCCGNACRHCPFGRINVR